MAPLPMDQGQAHRCTQTIHDAITARIVHAGALCQIAAPVLSEHSMSMPAISPTADMRATIAPSLASSLAPSASVTERTVGMAMGIPPTMMTSRLVRVGQPSARHAGAICKMPRQGQKASEQEGAIAGQPYWHTYRQEIDVKSVHCVRGHTWQWA